MGLSQMRVVIVVDVKGLGTALKEARKAAGISLVVAGDRAGMSGASFNRIENEEYKTVDLGVLLRAARAVDLDLFTLLGDWVTEIPGLELPSDDSAAQ